MFLKLFDHFWVTERYPFNNTRDVQFYTPALPILKFGIYFSFRFVLNKVLYDTLRLFLTDASKVSTRLQCR